MKGNKYETVAEEFNNNFERHRHKKIVLYGLGQYTKEILEKAKEFQSVFLKIQMDVTDDLNNSIHLIQFDVEHKLA